MSNEFLPEPATKDIATRSAELYGPWRSPEQKNLVKALHVLQGQMKPAPKSSKAHQYNYADLVAVMNACLPLMAELGLSVQQFQRQQANGSWQLETTIYHDSGEYIRGMTPILPSGPKIQDFGGAVTYARRYGLMSALGMTSEEEDLDGNAPEDDASGRRKSPLAALAKKKEAKPVTPIGAPGPPPKGVPGFDKIAAAFEELGVTREQVREYLGHGSATLSLEEVNELRNVKAGMVKGAATWDDALSVRRAKMPPPLAAEAILRAAKERPTGPR